MDIFIIKLEKEILRSHFVNDIATVCMFSEQRGPIPSKVRDDEPIEWLISFELSENWEPCKVNTLLSNLRSVVLVYLCFLNQ